MQSACTTTLFQTYPNVSSNILIIQDNKTSQKYILLKWYSTLHQSRCISQSMYIKHVTYHVTRSLPSVSNTLHNNQNDNFFKYVHQTRYTNKVTFYQTRYILLSTRYILSNTHHSIVSSNLLLTNKHVRQYQTRYISSH